MIQLVPFNNFIKKEWIFKNISSPMYRFLLLFGSPITNFGSFLRNLKNFLCHFYYISFDWVMNDFLSCVIFCSQNRLFLAEAAVLGKVFWVYIPNSTEKKQYKNLFSKKVQESTLHCKILKTTRKLVNFSLLFI